MYTYLYINVFVVQHGWLSGESARLSPMCPGFDSRTRRHMWVEFVVGSRPWGPFLEVPDNYRAR